MYHLCGSGNTAAFLGLAKVAGLSKGKNNWEKRCLHSISDSVNQGMKSLASHKLAHRNDSVQRSRIELAETE